MNKGPNPKFFLGLTIIAAAAGMGLCYMAWSDLGDDQMHLATLKKQVRDQKQLDAELKDSQDKVELTRTQIKHLESGISDMAYVPTMLIELNKVCQQTGIRDLAVRPLPEPPKDPKKEAEKHDWKQLDIEVSGNGDYPAVMQLIKALQQFPKIVGVREVSLVPKQEIGNNEPSGQVTATIKINAYTFKSKDDGKKKVTPLAKEATHNG